MKKSDACLQWGRTVLCSQWERWQQETVEPSAVPIDVVIPIIGKDLDILPLCLKGVRRQVSHPIRDIYIVAPEEKAITDFCRSEQLTFVDERTILGFGPREIGLIATNKDGSTVDRSGWLFQQLVKLSGNIGTCSHYLTVDADHILIRPHTFIDAGGRTLMYMSDEYHGAYYDNIRRLTGHRYWSLLSYVGHKMLFSKEELAKLRKHIETYNGKPWTEAIIDSYDRRETSGFSEFELYGDFLHEKKKLPWCQLRLHFRQLADYETLVSKYGTHYRSITFPSYLK